MILPKKVTQTSSPPKYFVYPSLLNSFHYYRTEKTGFTGEPWVTDQKLLDSINKVKTPTTEAQQKGKDFEDNLMRFAKGRIIQSSEHLAVIKEVSQLLPIAYEEQKFVKCRIGDFQYYGYVDVVGSGQVIDIKTTSNYDFPAHIVNHQTTYMIALKAMGYVVNSMTYLITDFKKVYNETYYFDSYDWSVLFEEMEAFGQYLEANRSKITNTKIFTGK